MASINLSWSAPSGGAPVTSYNILRGTTAGGEVATPIATVPASQTTYSDTSVVAGDTYFYQVTASNAAGTSAPSNEATATAGQAPGAPVNLTAVGSN